MSENWEIRQDDRGWAVWRNGRWYSDVDDEQDGLGLVRGRRAKEVTIVDSTGHRQTRKP